MNFFKMALAARSGLVTPILPFPQQGGRHFQPALQNESLLTLQ